MRFVIFVLVWVCAAGLSVKAQQPQASASAELISGITAYNGGDFASALEFLRAAANKGEPEAMVNLGYMYARGQGVAADPAFALQLYRRAAEAGDGEAMNAIGFRYNHAPQPDLEKAIQWYCRAVLRGNPRAMNNAALLFYRGQGVNRDRGEARSLWRQAAEKLEPRDPKPGSSRLCGALIS